MIHFNFFNLSIVFLLFHHRLIHLLLHHVLLCSILRSHVRSWHWLCPLLMNWLCPLLMHRKSIELKIYQFLLFSCKSLCLLLLRVLHPLNLLLLFLLCSHYKNTTSRTFCFRGRQVCEEVIIIWNINVCCKVIFHLHWRHVRLCEVRMIPLRQSRNYFKHPLSVRQPSIQFSDEHLKSRLIVGRYVN